MKKRKAIALMITLFFVMLISIAVGYGLKITNKAKISSQKEKFLIQTNIIVDDVLMLFNNSRDISEIAQDGSGLTLNMFLSSSSFIPLKSAGYDVIIKIKSARDRFNINNLKDNNGNIKTEKFKRFKNFLISREIQDVLGYMILDSISKNKKDLQYVTDIFYQNPNLYRKYIASRQHFDKILRYYATSYNDNVFSKLNFDKLLIFKKTDTRIDLNYANETVWELLLGCTKERAVELASMGGSYQSLKDLNLSEDEKKNLEKFNTSFFEPILAVSLEISKDSFKAKIEFEYDLKTKRATNFVYKI